MSEYWKSTPKYWCKFCKIFVRDTTLEKKQHEATAKHQNNISKSLRDLHKNQGREDRDKQRAKDEVARLNGLVGGKAGPSASGPSQPSVAKSKPHFTSTGQRATGDDRRRQAEQLAAMGIALPDEYRKDMAIASEWSTVSATPVYHRPPIKDDDVNEDSDEDKKDILTADRPHKRKLDLGDDEHGVLDDEQTAGRPAKKSWGTSLKTYPGREHNDTQDFDDLLLSTKMKKEVKSEPEVLEGGVQFKQEESDTKAQSLEEEAQQDAAVDTPVVFKKRKGKR